MLRVNGLTVGYHQMEVLRAIDFTVEEGVTAFLGANGSGKTTLLKTLSGLLKPTAGHVWFREQEITGWPAERTAAAGLIHVPEGRHVFSDLTVEENLRLGAYLQARGEKQEKRLAEVYRRFPRLAERRKQPGGTLSGGEQQLLALGRGLMSNPRLLLLDEPSMGLSPLMVKEILHVILSLKADGIPILLIEENAALALQGADQGYVLANGKIVLSGSREMLEGDSRIAQAYLGLGKKENPS